jgi:hypothetical protein
VISRQELFILLNIGSSTIEHADSVANLVSMGLVVVHADQDAIVSLGASTAGRERIAPILPSAAA